MAIIGALLSILIIIAAIYFISVMFPHWFKQGYRGKSMIVPPVLPMQSAHVLVSDSINPLTPQKGYDFEKFVVKKFPREYFSPITWRSDKYVDGIYASSNRDPDLLMEYRDPSRVVRFAVECKWRSGFKNGFIQWAKDYQIQNYFEYQRRERIPVFIIIGVGGSEERPSDLYIIPLKDLKSNKVSLHADNLKRYRRADPEKMFFLDIKSVTLK
jgi:hypothetical protein